MLQPRTLKILAALVALYLLALSPGLFVKDYFDSPVAWLLLVPLFTVYLLHRLGLPGLLEHGGLCGWGMCEPTALGWCAALVFWVAVAWLVARGLDALRSR